MIYDSFENVSRYFSISRGIEAAAEAMKAYSKEQFPIGKCSVDGEQVFLNLQAYETAPLEARQMEIHEKYMDIFYLVEGQEMVLMKPSDKVSCIVADYDPDKDIAFALREDDAVSIVLREGDFVMLFPGEAHASGIDVDGSGTVKKIVGKVQMKE